MIALSRWMTSAPTKVHLTARSYDDLARSRYKIAKGTAAIVALGGLLTLFGGISHGFNAKMHLPIMAVCVLACFAFYKTKPGNFQTYTSFVIASILIAIASVMFLVQSITLVLYIPVILIIVLFGESNKRKRQVFSGVLFLQAIVVLARFHGDVSTPELPLDALYKVAAIDAVVTVLTGGFVLRFYVDSLRATRQSIAAIQSKAEADTTASRELLELAKSTQLELQGLQEATRAALAKTQLRRARLSASREQQRQFTYAASHDLKEPIRTIRSFLQMVKRRLSAERIAELGLEEHFDHVDANASAMHGVLESMLEYSQLVEQELTITEVDPVLIWHKARVAVEVPLASADMSVYLAKGGSTASIKTDARMLQLLLQELIINGRRFTNDPDAKLTFSVTKSAQGQISLSVTDKGIGIEPAYHQQVFGLFKRLHSQADHPGSGVGLALVRRIAHLMGGEVTLASQPGVGTTVTLVLPKG